MNGQQPLIDTMAEALAAGGEAEVGLAMRVTVAGRARSYRAVTVILAVMVMVAAGCSDSGGRPVPAPIGFDRQHNSLDDYGRSTGYTNPNACWRSISTATCF